MSDLFHEGVPEEYIVAVVKVMTSREVAYISGADEESRALGEAP